MDQQAAPVRPKNTIPEEREYEDAAQSSGDLLRSQLALLRQFDWAAVHLCTADTGKACSHQY